MLERESEYFSKYAVDPDLDDYFDSFELPEFGFKKNTEPEPDLDDIDLDDMDEDMWGEY
jgi:hypothetical protein